MKAICLYEDHTIIIFDFRISKCYQFKLRTSIPASYLSNKISHFGLYRSKPENKNSFENRTSFIFFNSENHRNSLTPPSDERNEAQGEESVSHRPVY